MNKSTPHLGTIQQELMEAQQVLDAFLNDPAQLVAIEKAATLMAEAILADHKIISCGNGGSHCDAMHFAEELTGRYRDNRRALPAIAISDPSHLSCVSNDFGYEFVFSRFVEGLGQPGDVLLGLSTSGNSANIVRAVEAARNRGMKVVILSGKDGGKLAGGRGNPRTPFWLRGSHSGNSHQGDSHLHAVD
jgi:D-sedoheptulose 7-phosphate isomerase